jgi:hypothetical protein
MRGLLNSKASFTDDDYAIIAEDFAITDEDARELLNLLQSSFDSEGHLKEFAKYERNIFQFLWHYLKQINNRQDRVSSPT